MDTVHCSYNPGKLLQVSEGFDCLLVLLDYSSILLHIGTNLGHIATFKLLPDSGGRYTVDFVGATSLDERIVSISPLNADTGHSAYASQSAVASLRNGFKVNGVLLCVSQSEARLFKPASSKGAHKAWEGVFCHAAAVARYEDLGYALLGLFGDGTARAYSIPALKEIGMARVDHIFDVKVNHSLLRFIPSL